MNEAQSNTKKYGVLRGVVFDMDGTLTLPSALDLAGVRARHNIAAHADIMATVRERLASADPAVRASGEAALADVERVEAAGVAAMELQPGAAELLATLRGTPGLRTALVTRNTRAVVAAFAARVLAACGTPACGLCGCGARALEDELFDAVITRDDLPDVPHKPAPGPLLHLAAAWGVRPQELVMVGDFIHDVQCGNAAGARTILLRNSTNGDYAQQATLAVDQLSKVLPAVLEWMKPL